MNSFRTSEFRVITENLGYPEGPIYQSDGSILLVEIYNGTLTRVKPDGSREVVADFGVNPAGPNQPRIACGPNGAAIGPDKTVYVCDNGGLAWMHVDPIPNKTLKVWVPTIQPPNYITGSIKRVSSDGKFTTLYPQPKGSPLSSPDDLVFDKSGGFWFTDWGKLKVTPQGLVRDITAVYYAQPDGSKITPAIPQRSAPNGIALSPDNSRLYVAETYARWIVYWELDPDSPGTIKKNPATAKFDGSYLLTGDIPGCGTLDSMAVDEEGNIYVATMLPKGQDPAVAGGITVISPKGKRLEFIKLTVEGYPEPLPSNLCFGGPDRKTAYITLAGTGRLVACEMKIPGKPLNFSR
jgi:gluconolactonase